MRIPPYFSDCAAFLCDKNKGRPGGTAFFVELEDAARTWVYLVTARHSIEEIPGRDIYVRVNTFPDKKGQVETLDIHTDKDDWLKHDNADVATIMSPIDRRGYDIQQVPLDLLIDRRYRFDVATLDGRGNPALEPMLRQNFPDGIAVETGDELFSPGLFIQSAGKNRNLPVVRFGNIARMPGDEMIVLSTRARGDISIRAYLAETHSWGGFSGAPVFWHFDYPIATPVNAIRLGPAQPTSPLALVQRTPQPERLNVLIGRGWAIALLGLVSGHYGIPTKAKNEDIETEINAGIAVVTPAENIRELLMSDEMKEARRQRAAKEKEPTATADFAPSVPRTQRTLAKREKDRIEIPIPSKGEVMDVFKKATRKRDKK